MLSIDPRNERFLKRVAVAAGIVGFGAFVAYESGYRWNGTESLPRGLWRISAVETVRVGEIAFFCPPARREFTLALDRGYIDAGRCPSGTAPLFKRLIAVEGDTVLLTADGLSVNGGPLIPNTAPLCADGDGRAMPVVTAEGVAVARGEAWFISDYSPFSYDSRYFGAVPLRLAKATAVPVWTYDP